MSLSVTSGSVAASTVLATQSADARNASARSYVAGQQAQTRASSSQAQADLDATGTIVQRIRADHYMIDLYA